MTPFDYLRKFKEVSEETETLVNKKAYLGYGELLKCFENGISGLYGKVYSLDPQTLLGWVRQYKNDNSAVKAQSAPLSSHATVTSREYPQGNNEWYNVCNNSFTAFLGGAAPETIHPDIYDWLVLEGKIDFGSLKKIPGYPEITEIEISKGKQGFVAKYFRECSNKGWNKIYQMQN